MLIVVLFVITIVPLVLNRAFPRVLVVEPGDQWKVHIGTDQSEGGNSVAKDRSTDRAFAMEYEMREGYYNPFTAMSIKPSKNQNFDLDWIEKVSIRVRYQGEGASSAQSGHVPENPGNGGHGSSGRPDRSP